ncbi:MAG: 4-hydroxy-3-methylbut-2-enyl diphosphate reductase [Patescibacteria group bacterium]|nr:4-hydroxy-3-methylbut-2-enyl diphosphate reductase [Patescibacteria group bacterium]
MKVNVAKNAGFCGGVNRAFMLVEKKFRNYKKRNPVFILGSLVHNENVMAVVEKWRIKKIETLRLIKKNDTVIITAHGVSKQKIKSIKKREAIVFDTTCPNVSRVHRCVRWYAEKKFEIIIFGDKKHKEVRGINGWCGKNARIIATKNETKKLARQIVNSNCQRPLLVVSQTTQNVASFSEAVAMLKRAARFAGRTMKTVDTICRATSFRQKEASRISKKNDAVIIIGGKKSANTRQLWKIAKNINKKVTWIDELNDRAKKKIKHLLREADTVGIVSGASTPKWDIDKTVAYLKTL